MNRYVLSLVIGLVAIVGVAGAAPDAEARHHGAYASHGFRPVRRVVRAAVVVVTLPVRAVARARFAPQRRWGRHAYGCAGESYGCGAPSQGCEGSPTDCAGVDHGHYEAPPVPVSTACPCPCTCENCTCNRPAANVADLAFETDRLNVYEYGGQFKALSKAEKFVIASATVDAANQRLTWMKVASSHRRQGIATEFLAGLNNHLGVTLQVTPTTQDGKAWVESLGDDALAVCPNCPPAT